ncbi:MAG: AAA family ATPase, partial [Anaerolineae bacterium]|nr:AAA family ATPase [Anaerolineae bacterium]
MFAKLFQTKIRIPPLQAQFVPRPDLIQRLNEAIQWDHRLVLVSAPAGYGKTTLVNEWVSAKTEQLAVAWLSLDSDDNLPSRFWVYLIHALQTTVPDLGTSGLQTLQSNFPPPFMAAMQNPGAAADQPALDLDGLILSPLLNELAALPTDLILVLDDYQHITDMRIQRGMARFLEHLPPRVHVVIVTRVDPPLPVVYMRAHNQLTELRAADLCFTARETDTYIQQLIAGGLKPADLEKLGSQTEGWIAGLQMAGLSIRSLLTQTQNQTRDERAERVSAFINAFSGKNQFIFDYLVKEVVQQQPAYVQEFLWKTSILERLSGPLCDYVVEPESIPGWPAGVTSQDILESLEGANLFLVPMDTERGWYRYHRLFADLLISRLRQAHKDWLPRLHCRASAWYEANGEINRAIYHAMESQAWDSAASLIEQYGGVLLRQGELDIVIRWMKAIPKEFLTSRPKLCLQQASAYVFANQLLEVGPLLQRVEHSLAAQNEGSPPPSLREDEIQTIRAEVYFLRAYTALAEGQREQALQIALDGIKAVPETCLAERSNIFWVAGFTANILGRYAEALQYLNQALHLARRNNDAWIMM